MSGTEALVAQGFPVHPIIHKGLDLCGFNVLKLLDPFAFSTRSMRAQAGNSMHLRVIAVQFLHFLKNVEAGYLIFRVLFLVFLKLM